MSLALLGLTQLALAAPGSGVARPGDVVVPEQTVELPCGYQPGQTHTYRLNKKTVREQGGESAVQQLGARVTLKVVTHDEGRTVLAVRYHDPALEGQVELGDRLTLAVAEGGYQVEVDHQRGEQRVVDLDEVMDTYQRIGDEVTGALQAEQPPMAAEAKAWVAAFVADRQMAEQRALAEVQPLVAFTCGRIPAEEIRYETAIPSPLGPTDLPARGRLAGKPGDQVVEVEVTERLDPARALDVLGPALAGLGVPLPEDATLDELQLQMSTTLQVQVDRTTGWPRRWSRERRGTVMGRGRVDTATMVRVDPG